ncbi:hypothetical protein GCM10023238_23780 [Streptomyces heliomycini]
MRPHEVAERAAKLAAEHDLVLVEGAGGLLVRFDAAGGTLADAAALLAAPVLVVASAGLGTLNVTELTARELRGRGLDLAGVVIGSWPAGPDLASRCNLLDLPDVTGAPLLGAVPAGAGALDPPGSGPRRRTGWLPGWRDLGRGGRSGRARRPDGGQGCGSPVRGRIGVGPSRGRSSCSCGPAGPRGWSGMPCTIRCSRGATPGSASSPRPARGWPGCGADCSAGCPAG